MAKGIVDRTLQGLITSPPDHRVEIPDGTVDGLSVRVGPGGKPTWAFRFRVTGDGGVTAAGTPLKGRRYYRINLGRYPSVSIRAAREKAAKYFAMAERGENPADEFAENAINGRDTVSTLVADYLAHAKATMRSWRHAQYYFDKHFIPAWGDRPAGKITSRDAASVIAAAIKGNVGGEPGPKPLYGAGSEVRKWGSMLFAWALRQRRVKQNPFDGVAGPRLRPRQRFLTMPEARAVWNAAEELPCPWRHAIQLLMLTACREGEICRARKAWLDRDEATLHIPATHYKTGRGFIVPVTTAAQNIIDSLPQDGGEFLLSTTDGRKPISGVPRKVLDQVHKHAEAILGRPIEHFRLHDLRRTARTHFSRLGTSEVVGELLLGHVLRGVQGTYNVYDFSTEKRHALELWSQELAERSFNGRENRLVACPH